MTVCNVMILFTSSLSLHLGLSASHVLTIKMCATYLGFIRIKKSLGLSNYYKGKQPTKQTSNQPTNQTRNQTTSCLDCLVFNTHLCTIHFQYPILVYNSSIHKILLHRKNEKKHLCLYYKHSILILCQILILYHEWYLLQFALLQD